MTPNPRLAACVPATDWNTRSTGAPCSSSSRVVVTWVSTQDWIGASIRCRASSISSSSARTVEGRSVAGLMPTTASPEPCSRPSTMLAVTPTRVVGGVVGLQAGGEPAGQPDRRPEPGDHAGLRGDRDEVGHAAELGGRRDHLRGEPGRERGEGVGVGVPGEQPVAQAADRHRAHRRERLRVVGVDDQARDVVVLVGHHRLVEEVRERQVGQRGLRRDPLGGRLGGHPGQEVARSAAGWPWRAGRAGR